MGPQGRQRGGEGRTHLPHSCVLLLGQESGRRVTLSEFTVLSLDSEALYGRSPPRLSFPHCSSGAEEMGGLNVHLRCVLSAPV